MAYWYGFVVLNLVVAGWLFFGLYNLATKKNNLKLALIIGLVICVFMPKILLASRYWFSN